MIAAIGFWACVVVLGYIYAGYPILVRILARAFGRPTRRAMIRPAVTVVIAAYNEVSAIRQKLDNVVSLDYPQGLLEVIVASDASSDGTDGVVQGYHSDLVQLVRVEGRRGKTACQNAALDVARGDVVVFTDATTRIDQRALIHLVESFADAEVGCVAGALVYEAKGDSLTARGGTSYWNYELGLRSAESRLTSLVGVSGCLYAVRRSAYRPIEPELISDFVIAFRMRERGLRTILEPNAVCYEDTHDRASNELAMRIRVAIRSINALVIERRLLNPFRYGCFAWQLWSHKLLRYASPFLWCVAIACNIVLAQSPFFGWLLALQFALIAMGVAGFALQRSGRPLGMFSKPFYFLLTNLASLIAAVRYVGGERMVTWKTVR